MIEALRQNETGRAFEWSDKAEEASQLVAEDRLTDTQIANVLKVGRATLARWKVHPDFDARVKGHVERFCNAVMRRGIGRVERRVLALQDRWDRMQVIIHERAEDMQGVPGGATGLLVRTYKSVGAGANAREVEEYAVDVGLLKELREHEKQAAQELGQWLERAEITTPVDPAQVRLQMARLIAERDGIDAETAAKLVPLYAAAVAALDQGAQGQVEGEEVKASE